MPRVLDVDLHCGSRTGQIGAWLGAAAIALAPAALLLALQTAPAGPSAGSARASPFQISTLLDPDAATPEKLEALGQAGTTTIVFPVERAAGAKSAQAAARTRGMKVGLWVEVARAPDLAAVHPEWMTSLQGHDVWRRAFPDRREPFADEVTKARPWVPVNTKEGFAAQLERVVPLIAAAAQHGPIDFVFLNDLQGGPSACGCGNLLCRWSTDDGPRRTTNALSDEAARDFVRSVDEKLAQQFGGKSPVAAMIPVVTPECEAADHGEGGHCAGVQCFDSECWPAFWKQVTPLAAGDRTIGLLLLSRTFGRAAGDTAAPDWIRSRLDALAGPDARRVGPPIPASQCLVVIEADGRAAAAQAELFAARAAGASGVLVSEIPLDQSFTPWIVPLEK